MLEYSAVGSSFVSKLTVSDSNLINRNAKITMLTCPKHVADIFDCYWYKICLTSNEGTVIHISPVKSKNIVRKINYPNYTLFKGYNVPFIPAVPINGMHLKSTVYRKINAEDVLLEVEWPF